MPGTHGRGFDPCIRKSPWRRAWQPTSVLLPEKPPSVGSQGAGNDWVTEQVHTHTHTHTHTHILAPGLGCIASPMPWRELPVAKIKVSLCETVLSFSWPTVTGEKIKQIPHHSLNCLPHFFSVPGNSASKISSLIWIKKENTPDAHTFNRKCSKERKEGASCSPLRYPNSSFCPAKISYHTHTHTHTHTHW